MRHLARSLFARWLAPARRRLLVRSAGLALVATGVVWQILAILPSPLAAAGAAPRSLGVVDREGRVLRELVRADGTRSRPIAIGDVTPHLRAAVESAEDRRFRLHPGIDPIAIARALRADLMARRLVEGGSTLTMQVAKLARGRTRRGLADKGVESLHALRIEVHHSKDEILVEWLNRVPMGNGLVGIEAAALAYFGVPARVLTPAQAAALVAVPRAPSLRNPWRRPERLRAGRDVVLRRMARSGALDPAALARALAEPLAARPRARAFLAPHFVEALAERGILAAAAGGVVRTSLDLELQGAAERILGEAVDRLRAERVTNGAVVVLENRTREVLAWVGSVDFRDEDWGQVDGVLAARQPGSALKPFVYGVAMESAGLTAASLLEDLPARFSTGRGTFAPENHDRTFQGPVRARVALASSLNVPAVRVAERAGVGRVVERLRALGLDTLTEDPGHYGLGIALGDGDIRLLDLVAAYATLAEGGITRPVVLLAGAARAAPRRVLDARVAWLLADVLSDDDARAPTFGQGSVLALPFAALVKTGTTKSFRDNWCVGGTTEVTVGVWVGNADGSPMRRVTGVTGAGPVWRAVLVEAMRQRPLRAFPRPDGIVEAEVCPLSGLAPGPSCVASVRERFVAGTEPGERCAWHVMARVDARSGRTLHPGCPGGEARVFERFPAALEAWARSAARPLVPPEAPPCAEIAALVGGDAAAAYPPGVDAPPAVTRLRIVSPDAAAVYAFDPGIPAAVQRLALAARLPDGARGLEWTVDGERVLASDWGVRRGEHVFAARARVGDQVVTDEVVVHVR